ncbi:LysR family transcriptional regulator [Paracoccus kondratievae]|uniref:LysR family transcriptional regulator n=1 Tax=Paracoccus kondratievae TaxID=135740 RepID=A0AAD3NX82_9RHOB|nr:MULTISPECIES: LysR family transcriptional regulator [Paracoccus]QFQ86814.1 LysR family transcriptional regulator [Paracoccus kondratievae]GLK63597.1 LysR family transcriptional regulator [Paracoccus kondratievae]
MQHIALRYFQEVAETGSITKAATRLNVSASAVSRQIIKLEENLSATLFERHPRGMVLSQAGQQLARHVSRIALETEMALTEIRNFQAADHGHIRLASYEGYAIETLSQAVARFREKHPKVTVHAWVGNSEDICARVLAGKADIGITYSHSSPPGLTIQLVEVRPIYALIPRDNPLARRASVSLEDLRGQDFAFPDNSRSQRKLIETALAARGFNLNRVFSTNSMAMLKTVSCMTGCVMFSTSVRGQMHGITQTHAEVAVEDEVFSGSVLQVVTMAGRQLPQPVRNFLASAFGITEPLA